MRVRYLAGLAVVAYAGAAGCTALLGDFSPAPADTTDASVPADANPADGSGTSDQTASQDGPATQDSRASDAGPDADAFTGPESGLDSGGDADASSCEAGATCVPSTCVNGIVSCTTSGPQCAVLGPMPPGTACEGGVCFSGSCVACNPGADCTDAGTCLQMAVVCSSGQPVCTVTGNVTNGTSCGTNMYCGNGVCAACSNGAPCAPTANPCHAGAVVCADGGITCTDQGTNVANGTSCGTNQVCDNGACNACTTGTPCNPPGNTCQTGTTSCATGVSTCGSLTNVSTGTACGGNQACNAGSCVTIAAPQLIAPLSTALATSQQPALRWVLATGTTGAQIDVCHDRACNSLVQTFAVASATGSPPAALPRGTYFWRARGMVGATVGTTFSPVWELRVGARSAVVNTSWGSVVDPNGDGYADLAVAATSVNSGAGAAYVYPSTGAGGISTSFATLTSSGGVFGYTLASAGDVNGDGFADILVGARDYASLAGGAFIYFGGPGGVSTTPNVTIPAPAGAKSFGGSGASAGDVNRDGYADVVLGAYGTNTNTGTAYVFYGGPGGTSTSPGTTLTGAATNYYFGVSAAGVGDVNGDGYGDVMVSATGYSSNLGIAYLYLGGPSGLSTSGAPFPGTSAGGSFGYSLWGADDVNGDGYADVIVGAQTANSNVGAAYVYLGGPGGLSTNATPTLASPGGANGFFGSSVSGAGDVSGDGYADVVVGAFEVTSGAGTAYVYLGGSSGLSTTPTTLTNPNPPVGGGGFFGFAVAAAGDVNGDGLGDIAVGAEENAGAAGMAYVFLGKSGGITTTLATSLTGPGGASGNFGKPVQ